MKQGHAIPRAGGCGAVPCLTFVPLPAVPEAHRHVHHGPPLTSHRHTRWLKASLCAQWTHHTRLQGSAPSLLTSTSLAQLWPCRAEPCPPRASQGTAHRVRGGARASEEAEGARHTAAQAAAENRPQEGRGPGHSQEGLPAVSTSDPPRLLPHHHAWFRGASRQGLTWAPPPLTSCQQAEPPGEDCCFSAWLLQNSTLFPDGNMTLSLAGIKPQETNISWN